MDERLRTNRRLWDHWTELHERSAFYDLSGFRAGRSSLNPIERRELGEVRGRSLLHLQCHFGLDTLSWARLGARVTGVDFSPRSIELARSLAEEFDLEAHFLCADLYELGDTIDSRFDIVFTSYGVLWWLPDLHRWAQVIADRLLPGGLFYMVEYHPFLNLLDDDGELLGTKYFPAHEPERYEVSGSYAVAGDASYECFGWVHSLSEIVNALLDAGLRIDFLHEHDYSPYGCFPFLEEREPGRYQVKGRAEIPVLFSARATSD